MTRTAAGAPTRRPAGAVLTGGLVGGVLGGLVAVVLGMVASAPAAGSAAVGALVAVGALSVGPLLLGFTRSVSPPAVMAIALSGYAVTMIVLAVVYVVLGAVGGLSGDQVGYGVIAATAGSAAGQVRAVARLRVLAFGTEPEVSTAGSGVAGNDSPASPPASSH